VTRARSTEPAARTAAALVVLGVLLAACSVTPPTPSPSAPASPPPSAQPSAPAGAAFLLRATFVQALPPEQLFGVLPDIVITLDGRALTGGAVPAIYPGPLLMPVIERQLTAAEWDRIIATARDYGLLSGVVDFTGGQLAPGAVSGKLEIVADGRLVTLTGNPSIETQCGAVLCPFDPGTPEAFATFWSRLDVGLQGTSLTGADRDPIGRPYVPTGYAVIVGPPAVGNPGLGVPGAPPTIWPLAGGLSGFGKALADVSGRRCGTVTGPDADAIRPLLQRANQLTRWGDPTDGSVHGLTVRALLPGDGDPCAGLV
jgi:hypothetical protein